MSPTRVPDPEDEPQRPPPDPFFDLFRVPKGDNVNAIVGEVLNQLANYEAYFGKRERARRPLDQDRHDRIVERLVCGLIHAHLMHEKPAAIALGNDVLGDSGRYASRVGGKQVRPIPERLAAPELAFVKIQKGTKGNAFVPGRRSTISAGPALRSRISEFEVVLPDIGEDLEQETIVLKRERKKFRDNGDRIDYSDTPITHQHRREMREINECLAAAEIEWDELYDGEETTDASDRLLHRFFNNGVFDQGGRLFGGFWQSLGSDQRLGGIWIGGERVAELDYGQMSLRLLYSFAEKKPPEGDLYDLEGFEFYRPHPRQAIKKVMSSMLYRDTPMTRWPRDMADIRPRGLRVERVIAALREQHQAVAHLFDQRIGFQLLFRESQIMVTLLLRLARQGIVALPIHDSIVVARSNAPAAEEAMHQVFHEHTGIAGIVTVEQATDVDPRLFAEHQGASG
jgi:hypothetical protein